MECYSLLEVVFVFQGVEVEILRDEDESRAISPVDRLDVVVLID